MKSKCGAFPVRQLLTTILYLPFSLEFQPPFWAGQNRALVGLRSWKGVELLKADIAEESSSLASPLQMHIFWRRKQVKKKSCAETEQKCYEIYCLFSQSSRWRMFGITFSPLHMPLCGTCGPSLLLHFSRDPVSRTGSSDISSTVANCNIQAAVNFPESALFPMPAKCASPEALSRDTSSRHSLWCNKSWEHSWHTGRALDVPAILIVLDSSLSPNCTVGRPVHSLLSAYLCPQAT